MGEPVDQLELLDRLNPTITELSQAIEQEVENYPEARRLVTHPLQQGNRKDVVAPMNEAVSARMWAGDEIDPL